MPWTENDKLASSIGAMTPEGIEFILYPAGLPARTLAYGIDKVVQWLIIIAISLAVIIHRNAFGIWLALILNFCVDWFYHVIFELFFRGQSPGKRIAGIRVVRSDGAPVDPASSFLRNLLRFADTFFFFFPIALICMTASSGFRRLGDWAGGTLVVYTSRAIGFRPAAHLSGRNSWLSKYEPVNPARPLSHDEKQAILEFARRYPLLGESRAGEIASFYAPSLFSGTGANNLSYSALLLGIARRLSGETGIGDAP
jgi:uncharacterized RDD family membrane protein YckC